MLDCFFTSALCLASNLTICEAEGMAIKTSQRLRESAMNETRNLGSKSYSSLQMASLRGHGHRGLPVVAVHRVDAVGGELADKILHHFRVAILKVKNPLDVNST